MHSLLNTTPYAAIHAVASYQHPVTAPSPLVVTPTGMKDAITNFTVYRAQKSSSSSIRRHTHSAQQRMLDAPEPDYALLGGVSFGHKVNTDLLQQIAKAMRQWKELSLRKDLDVH